MIDMKSASPSPTKRPVLIAQSVEQIDMPECTRVADWADEVCDEAEFAANQRRQTASQ